jgi:glutathione S-transferase
VHVIKVHHLNNSRSHRILWLLEEIGAPYEVVKYERDAATNYAPPSLKAVHPLGKSPVIEDDGRIIAESGAIVEYLAVKHGAGRLSIAPGDPNWVDYLHWMHFAEGSAMLPILLMLYAGRLGEAGAPIMPRINNELANHLSYMNGALAGREHLVADRFTAADIQNSFPLEAANMFGRLAEYQNLVRYKERLQARDAYQRALAKGGPYAMAR